MPGSKRGQSRFRTGWTPPQARGSAWNARGRPAADRRCRKGRGAEEFRHSQPVLATGGSMRESGRNRGPADPPRWRHLERENQPINRLSFPRSPAPPGTVVGSVGVRARVVAVAIARVIGRIVAVGRPVAAGVASVVAGVVRVAV